MFQVAGSRIKFREIDESDADLVVRWRNTDSARASFFGTDVVTPDTHRAFVRNRRPHDLVWVVEAKPVAWTGEHTTEMAVGMQALTVDVHHHVAEYGRTFIDPAFRGQGFAREAEYTLLTYAFEVLNLRMIWLDVFAANEPIIKMHHTTGFHDGGIDVVGHTNPRGPVLLMTFSREDWLCARNAFIERSHVTLGEWTP